MKRNGRKKIGAGRLVMAGWLFFWPVMSGWAVQPITGIMATYDNVSGTNDNYTVNGAGTGDFSSSNSYNIRFNEGTQNNLFLTGFEVGANAYNFVLLADVINIERVDNATTTGRHHVVLFEQSSLSGSDINLKNSALFTMEESLRSPIVNRGSDNVFANQGDGNGNNNNIQRIDYIFPDGFPVFNNIDQRGFLIMDRGGNDRFKIAAITSLDSNGKPSGFTDPVSVVEADWGDSGITIDTVVMRGYTEDGGELRPSANVSPQPLSGVFITWESMGLQTNDFIYGYSLAANDVTTNGFFWTEVNNSAYFPTNTTVASDFGGLDLISGGMMFFESDLDVTIGDFVWNDWNGNGIQDPGEPGIPDVLVHVYDVNTNLAAVTRTDADGKWNALGIGPGDFFVEFFLPDDYQFTVQNAGSDTTVDSNADPVAGRSEVFTMTSGQTNLTIDAGMYLAPGDLTLEKEVAPLSVKQGDTVVYSLMVTNSGPEDVDLIQVTDPLPAAVNFESYGATQGTYDETTGLWDIGELLTGASAALSVTGTVSSGFGGLTVTNIAEITRMNRPDTNPSDNTDSASFYVEQADLSVTKTVNNDQPSEGQSIDFTITLTNNGPDDAQNIEVTDVLPAGLTFDSASPGQGSYNSGTGVWTVGTVADGGSAVLVVTAVPDIGTGGSSLTNTVAITGSSHEDPDEDNNSDTAVITVKGADLAVTKSVDKPAASEGGTVLYTITVENLGPSTATGVEISDPLVTGLNYADDTPSQGTYNSGSGVWTVGTLANGASATLQIEATVDPGTMGQTLTNTAAVTASDLPDTNPANNEDSATVFVSALGIEKTSDVIGAAAPGDTITYTIVVTNMGSTAQTGVNVFDAVPAGTTYVADSVDAVLDPPPGPPAPPVDLRLLYENDATDASFQSLRPRVRIFNDGTNVLALTDIKLRYWFTSEPPGDDILHVDWAQVGTSTVTGLFGVVNGERYLEAGFTTAAFVPSWVGGNGNTNQLPVDAETGGIHLRIRDSAWGYYNQADDFSWDPDYTAYDEYERITLYYQGTKVWGYEPADYTTIVYNATSEFVVPAGISNVTVQAWGAGGGGGKASTSGNDAGGGGGGGGYARGSFSVTPGTTNTVTVGTGGGPAAAGGDSWFGSTSTLLARGGSPGGAGTAGDGGGNNIGNEAAFNGGNGGVGSTSGPPNNRRGGGGGGSATSTAAGGNGVAGGRNTGGTGGSGEGSGGNGTQGSVNGNPGNAPGGGGGGGGSGAVGGSGADGRVLVTYKLPVATVPPGETGAPPNLATDWTLQPGSTLTITFQVTVDSPATGTEIVNTASVTSDQETVPLADTVIDTLINTDLAVLKSVSNTQPDENDSITYTIVVTNNGPVSATGVMIQDVLPAGVTYVSDTPSQGSYSDATGLWSVGTVNNGASATLQISVTVDASTAGSVITNTATLFSSDVADSNPDNNEDSAVITVTGVDIGVGKTVSPPVPFEQEQLIYTVAVTNFGPSDATGVVIEDVLPSGLTYLSHSASSGAYNPSNGLWNIGGLPATQSETLQITARVQLGTAGNSITNTASVSSVDQPDTNEDNDSAEVIVVPETAPLDISKTAAPDEKVDPGDTVTYTIVVTNSSSVVQTGVTVTDSLPEGVTYVGGTLTVTAPADVPDNFLDRFNLRSYSQNNGNQNWTGSWIEGGESDGPTAGDIQILFDSVRGTTYSLRMAGPNRSLAREADLSEYDNATLQFDYRRQGLASGEYFAVEVSSNGVAGVWTELDRFEGPATDSSYTTVDYDITAWISTNTAVRFVNSIGTMDVSDIVWFDDVEIVSNVRTQVTTVGGAPPTLAEVADLHSGETITITLDVTVDEPGEIPEIFNTASVTSDQMTQPRTDTAAIQVDITPTLAVITAVRSRVEDEVAVISWEVSLELDTVGYYLERLANGEWVRISPSLIWADPFAPLPRIYEQADSGAPLGTVQRYRIIELENRGRVLTYGPYDLELDGGEISYETWAAGIDWNGADSSPDADPDGDGRTNRQEYLAGTDPLKANLIRRVTRIEPVKEGVRLIWDSETGRVYAVEMTLRLRDPFMAVAAGLPADPPENTHIVPVDSGTVRGAFFRIIME